MIKNLFFSLWLTLTCLLTTAVFGQQVLIFKENMGTSTTGTVSVENNVFQNSSTSGISFEGNTDVRITIPSSGYTDVSGGRNVWFSNDDRNFKISGINTREYSNIILSFGLLSTTKNELLTVEYSINGGDNFYPLTINETVHDGNKWNLKTITANIPSAENLILNFKKSSSINYRLDDVKLMGTRNNTPPVIPSNQTITGTYGVALSNARVNVTGNVTEWIIDSETLPSGVDFNNVTGVFSGTPTEVGNFPLVLKAKNSVGESAPETVTFDIAKANQTVSGLGNLSKFLGDENYSLPTETEQGQPIIYQSNDSNVVRIEGNVLSFVGIGNTTVTANAIGGDFYEPLVEQSFNVSVGLKTPTALAATDITFNSFQANWESIGNVLEYEVNVFKNELTTSPELVVNGDFNNELSDWSGTGFDSFSITNEDDNNFIKKLNTGTSRVEQTVDVTSGQDYVMEFWYKDYDASSPNGLKNYTIQGETGSVYIDAGAPKLEKSIEEWKIYRKEFTATSDKIKISIRAYQNVSIDKISVKSAGNVLGQTPIQGSPFYSTTNSLVINGLNELSTYTYNVIAKQNEVESEVSNSIEVTTLAIPTTTWNGTTWSNGEPTTAVIAVLEGNPTTSFTAKKVIVNAADVEVPSGVTITVEDNLEVAATASITFKNGSSFLQKSELANVGNVSFEVRSKEMHRNDMSQWASPVTGQNIRAFSPETLYNRFWSYDEATSAYTVLFTTNEDARAFEKGKGYSIRVRNTLPTANTEAHNGIFTGSLNNGNVTVAVTNTGAGFNLVGNPYPSAIKLDGNDGFFTQNPKVDQIFIWTPHFRLGDENYGNNYITVTSTAATGPGVDTNIRTIAAGQGFFVKANATSEIKFNNSMRVGGEANFYRTQAADKFSVSLVKNGVTVNTLAIGYYEGATEGVDHQMDAKSVETGAIKIYTLIGNEAFSIQARGAFTAEDRVQLGYVTNQAGELTIDLASNSGLFTGDQAVYLVDHALNTVHNLSEGAYAFTTEVGQFDSRFEIVYEERTLTTTDFTVNNVSVYNESNATVVAAKANNLKEIVVYDITGKVITKVDNINAKSVKLDLAKGVYYLQIVLDNGTKVSEKVLTK